MELELCRQYGFMKVGGYSNIWWRCTLRFSFINEINGRGRKCKWPIFQNERWIIFNVILYDLNFVSDRSC